MDFVKPIKTLHGTNPESLQNDYVNAYSKLREAMEAFQNIEFNARDYSDFNTFCKAKEERREFCSRIATTLDYLEDIASSI